MGIAHYLAMTAEEITAAADLPCPIAYMACHFSPYSTGLTGRPAALPKASMLILNDRIPWCGHDAAVLSGQLEEMILALECSCLLLDLQRPDTPALLAQALVKALPCPVGVPGSMAAELDCPVFLPPVPPQQSVGCYLEPWAGREIWLEAEPEAVKITVDAQGSRTSCPEIPEECALSDEALFCRYRTEVFPDRAEFTLQRTREDLPRLLEAAASLGVTRAVSLYQLVKKLPVT